MYEHYFNSSSKIELYEYLKPNTQPSDVILIQPDLEKKLMDLERRIDRPTLNIFKFIPSSKEGLVEGYKRREYRTNIFDDFNYKHSKYHFNYLIIDNNSNDNMSNKNRLSKVFSNQDYLVLSN